MRLQLGQIPLLPGVLDLAQQGHITGASGRNWASYGDEVSLPAGISPAYKALLSDPQTSGGLLVACAPEAADRVLDIFVKAGFAHAAVIGHMAPGAGLDVL
jgi:selenide,water dikinase